MFTTILLVMSMLVVMAMVLIKAMTGLEFAVESHATILYIMSYGMCPIQ